MVLVNFEYEYNKWYRLDTRYRCIPSGIEDAVFDADVIPAENQRRTILDDTHYQMLIVFCSYPFLFLCGNTMCT